VRLLVRNEQGTDCNEVRFRADITARLDPGIHGAGIQPRWRGSVKHNGRTFNVTLYDKPGESNEWFFADIIDTDDDES
jgi:hypothetical protein